MSTQQLLEIRAIADRASADFSEQLLVPQSHYVDILLDLRAATHNPIVRTTIDARLSDIRFVTMIDTSDVRADLMAIVGISEFDDPFEMAWAEAALTCDCAECAASLHEHVVSDTTG
jgi:hypothetical protein